MHEADINVRNRFAILKEVYQAGLDFICQIGDRALSWSVPNDIEWCIVAELGCKEIHGLIIAIDCIEIDNVENQLPII